MKIPPLVKIALLTFTVVLAGSPCLKADDAGTPPPPPPVEGQPHHDSVLTPDERAELKKDRDQVFASDPDLQKEGKDLMDQRSSMKDASAEDKQAFHEKMHAFQDKLDAAIEKIDANAAPLIAKVKAARHHHDADGGPGAGSNSGSSSSQ
jgi:hypothetical protein